MLTHKYALTWEHLACYREIQEFEILRRREKETALTVQLPRESNVPRQVVNKLRSCSHIFRSELAALPNAVPSGRKKINE